MALGTIQILFYKKDEEISVLIHSNCLRHTKKFRKHTLKFTNFHSFHLAEKVFKKNKKKSDLTLIEINVICEVPIYFKNTKKGKFKKKIIKINFNLC